MLVSSTSTHQHTNTFNTPLAYPFQTTNLAHHRKAASIYMNTPPPRALKAALFDFIGTTVKEKDPDIINKCFVKAFIENNVHIDPTALREHRGKNKIEIFEVVLKSQNLPVLLAPVLYDSFLEYVGNNISSFCEMEGAEKLFSQLRKKKIKIGLGTGLPRVLLEKIMHHLKWNKSVFDYIGTAEEVGRSRPHPDMIFDMAARTKLSDPREILKIGDTIADIQEGKNAGVMTAVILSGTQDQQDLLKEGPDFVINSLSEIEKIMI